MATTLATIPEQGQLVSVRSRRWLVNDVALSSLPASGLKAIDKRQSLLTLSPNEDDGRGEEF